MSEVNPTSFDDELLSAYVDGELTAEERAQVESRLASDPAARQLVAELQALSRSLRALPRSTADENVRAAVLNRVAESASLPGERVTLTRRFLWPVLAVAAMLMLMFIQPEQKDAEVDVAKVEPVPATEPAEETPAATPHLGAAFEAMPAASAPVMAEEAPAPEGATLGRELVSGEREAESRSRGGEYDGNFAAAGIARGVVITPVSNVGLVQLKLNDLRSGTERFDRMLFSNGIQVIDESDALSATEPETTATDAVARDLTADTAEPLSAGVATRRASSPERGDTDKQPAAAAEEPEMVLVEATPQQIENVLQECNQDTATIQSVVIDEATLPEAVNQAQQQQFGQFRRYARSAPQLKSMGKLEISPKQQAIISVLNSPELNQMPDSSESMDKDSQEGLAQQAWAGRVLAKQYPPDAQQLQQQIEMNRSRRGRGQLPEQKGVEAVPERLQQNMAQQNMRVLFFLVPGDPPAKASATVPAEAK